MPSRIGFGSSAAPAAEVPAGQGKCAVAVYDYQAGDDDELTFDPGEMITNIEFVSSNTHGHVSASSRDVVPSFALLKLCMVLQWK